VRYIPLSNRIHCSADSIINVALPGSKTLQISHALTCFRAVRTHQIAHAVATQHRITAGGLPTGHTCTGIATAMFGEPWEQEGVSLGFEPQFVAHRADGMMHPLCVIQALAALMPSCPHALCPLCSRKGVPAPFLSSSSAYSTFVSVDLVPSSLSSLSSCCHRAPRVEELRAVFPSLTAARHRSLSLCICQASALGGTRSTLPQTFR
jgi:hypothetical protein